MPKKLTKDQKQYRKRKKNRKGKLLAVNISQDSFDKVMAQAVKEQVPGYAILNRMIWQGLRTKEGYVVRAYAPHLQNPPDPDLKISYKGAKGEKAIRWWISTTAWIKLDRHAKAGLQQSKSRVVESLIQNYQFLSEAQRERNIAYEARNRELYGWYYNRSTSDAGALRPQRKAWEYQGMMPVLRPGLTLDHLSEEELEEFTDGLAAYCRHQSHADRDSSFNQAEALPALSEQERLELISHYMDQHPEQ
jgi:hypothetical protein